VDEHVVGAELAGDAGLVADEVFEENMVASAETFLYRAGVGSAGIETNYIVGKEGVEVITPSPLLWW